MRGKLLGAIAAIVVAAGIAQAQAVTLHTGGSATYDFDLSGLNPPPPYAMLVQTFFGLSGVDAGDVATFRYYDGFGATGTNVRTDTDDPLDQYMSNLGGQDGEFAYSFESGILDGKFSVVITAVQGSFGIESALADGLNSSGFYFMEPVGVLVAVNDVLVPEPGSLALLGGGFAALLSLRRRARS